MRWDHRLRGSKRGPNYRMRRECRGCSSCAIRERRFAAASMSGVRLDLLELLGLTSSPPAVASPPYGHPRQPTRVVFDQELCLECRGWYPPARAIAWLLSWSPLRQPARAALRWVNLDCRGWLFLTLIVTLLPLYPIFGCLLRLGCQGRHGRQI